jgi:hypothetical protein
MPAGSGLEPPVANPAPVATFLGNVHDGGASSQTLGSRAVAIPFFHRVACLVASSTGQRGVRDLLESTRREYAGRDHEWATTTAKTAFRGAHASRVANDTAIDVDPSDHTTYVRFGTAVGRDRWTQLVSSPTSTGPASLFVTIRKSKTDQAGRGSSRRSRGRAQALRGSGGRSVARYHSGVEGAAVRRVDEAAFSGPARRPGDRGHRDA